MRWTNESTGVTIEATSPYTAQQGCVPVRATALKKKEALSLDGDFALPTRRCQTQCTDHPLPSLRAPLFSLHVSQ